MAFTPQTNKPQWFKAKMNSPAYLKEAATAVTDHKHLLLAKSQARPAASSGREEVYKMDEGEVVPSVLIEPGDEKETLPPLQQSDEMKPLLLDIGRYGLTYAYQKTYHCHDDPEKYKFKKTKHPQKVIIVGAGPAGLVAGYELKRAGHQVVILERQHRVGGRVKTISDSHFYKGLWGDSGAMRLPGEGDPGKQPPTEASHFMVDFYAGKEKFNIPKIPFVNECKFGYYKFYGQNQIRMDDWELHAKKYCNHFWPGWDKKIRETSDEDWDKKQINIQGIGDYYDASVKPVIQQLYDWEKEYKRGEDKQTPWTRWVEKWARFSFINFITSTVQQIKLKLKQSPSVYSKDDDKVLKNLENLLPWPIEAVVAYTTFSYTENLDQSLVELLRDDIGQWWKMPMHTFTEGLQMLPWSFMKFEKSGGFEGDDMDLSKSIVFGARAHSVTYTSGNAIVDYYDETSGSNVSAKGDAVIVTLPVHIIRQLKFDPPLPFDYYAALENINYGPSTKILLQCRERFWEKEGINGGFSKTNMPIGQLHYPSNPKFEIPNTDRGILMCYTWKQEALLFGSQSPHSAISEAVREIEEIHPKIREYFEVGAVQAWYSDPSAQGAYGLLKPMQYLSVEKLIDEPHECVYFAGEALSNTNGWIQGALESGLRAAFQFFTVNEDLFIVATHDQCTN